MPEKPHISIVGRGKVGTSIAALAAKAGWVVRTCHGRDFRGVGRCSGRLILLTVPDDAIEAVCKKLVAAGALQAGDVVAHCSGAMDSSILRAAAELGCFTGSMHPIQTFPTVRSAMAAMPGAYCYIEGHPAAQRVLRRLVRSLGMKPLRVAGRKEDMPGESKTRYHAAACIASNYLVTIIDAALRAGEAAGIGRREFLRALGPLVRATLENALSLGPEKALTGPIARGDSKTVLAHIKALGGVAACNKLHALQSGAPLAQLYAELALHTISLARRKGTLSAAAARKLLGIVEQRLIG